MQEEKDLNNGNDHSRFISPSVPNSKKETTLNSEETISTHEVKVDSKETTEFTITDIDNLTTPSYLITEKVSSSTEKQEIVEEQEPSQQDYQNKYSNQPYQNYQTNNQAYRSVSSETNIFGIIGLVAAIFSWVILFFPVIAPLFWLLGLICSSIGMFKKPRGLATAGLVISLAGLLIGIILIVLILTTGRIHAVQNI